MSGSKISISVRKEKWFPNKHRSSRAETVTGPAGYEAGVCQDHTAWSYPTPSLPAGLQRLWPSALRSASLSQGLLKLVQGNFQGQLFPLLNMPIHASMKNYMQCPTLD